MSAHQDGGENIMVTLWLGNLTKKLLSSSPAWMRVLNKYQAVEQMIVDIVCTQLKQIGIVVVTFFLVVQHNSLV